MSIPLAVCATAIVGLALDWTVKDDGTTTVFGKGAGDGQNHVFRNNGTDDSIEVIVYTETGAVYASYVLEVGTDCQVYIPSYGSCTVNDSSDGDRDGAKGTYT